MYKISEGQLLHFIKENQQKLYRFTAMYVRNEEDAKDILQNTILKAYRKYHQIRSADTLSSWFYHVLINECLLHIRKSKRREDTQEMDVFSIKTKDTLQQEQLWDMIHRLDEKSQMIIVLRFFEERKLKEIAAIMDMPLSTVKSRLYKSLEELRVFMEYEDTCIKRKRTPPVFIFYWKVPSVCFTSSSKTRSDAIAAISPRTISVSVILGCPGFACDSSSGTCRKPDFAERPLSFNRCAVA